VDPQALAPLYLLWNALAVLQRKKGSEPFTEKGTDPNGANLSRLVISIRHLRGRKLDRQAASASFPPDSAPRASCNLAVSRHRLAISY
jgi:hypothetical protein